MAGNEPSSIPSHPLTPSKFMYYLRQSHTAKLGWILYKIIQIRASKSVYAHFAEENASQSGVEWNIPRNPGSPRDVIIPNWHRLCVRVSGVGVDGCEDVCAWCGSGTPNGLFFYKMMYVHRKSCFVITKYDVCFNPIVLEHFQTFPIRGHYVS